MPCLVAHFRHDPQNDTDHWPDFPDVDQQFVNERVNALVDDSEGGIPPSMFRREPDQPRLPLGKLYQKHPPGGMGHSKIAKNLRHGKSWTAEAPLRAARAAVDITCNRQTVGNNEQKPFICPDLMLTDKRKS